MFVQSVHRIGPESIDNHSVTVSRGLTPELKSAPYLRCEIAKNLAINDLPIFPLKLFSRYIERYIDDSSLSSASGWNPNASGMDYVVIDNQMQCYPVDA